MPKIVNHEEYREDILKGSFALFARKGYDAVSMREIAKELNISTGTLYHYFASKSEIFRQMIELLSRNRVLQIMDGLKDTYNPKDKLNSMIENVLASEKFFQDLLFLLFDYLRKSKTHDPENFIEPIFTYYKVNVQKQLGIHDEEHAGVVINFILGLLIQRMMKPDTDVKQQVKAFLTLYGTFALANGAGLSNGFDISEMFALVGATRKN